MLSLWCLFLTTSPDPLNYRRSIKKSDLVRATNPNEDPDFWPYDTHTASCLNSMTVLRVKSHLTWLQNGFNDRLADGEGVG